MATPPKTPITVALVDDYDVVLIGVANMFDRYRDRVVVAEIDSNMGLDDAVDIVLYDSFAQPESDHEEIAHLVANPRARRVVVYTWNFHPDLIESARQHGAHGTFQDAARARSGRRPGGGACRRDRHQRRPPRARSAPGLNWPGRGEGLSDRESEILALITQGKSNAEVAALTYLSPNTIKSYIRTIYRKIGAASRTQAVLWGVKHGFTPDHNRIDHWKGGPERLFGAAPLQERGQRWRAFVVCSGPQNISAPPHRRDE